MNQLNINLLPLEARTETKKTVKETFITRISIGILVVGIIITASVLLWSLKQNQDLARLNSESENLSKQIQNLAPKESLVVLLKNRIDRIKEIVSKESTQTQVFNLVLALAADKVSVSSIKVSQNSNINLVGKADSIDQTELFFDTLTDPTRNEGKLQGVKIEKFIKSAAGAYNFELNITSSLGESKDQNKKPENNKPS